MSDSLLDALAERRILTVSQLNRSARRLLETHFPLVWVAGEISNFSRPASGHWYFTLKDEHAQLRCAMFRGDNQRLRFKPENGMKVTVRGRVGLYEARGDYQLIAEHLEDSGLGALQRAFEQLKEALNQRGWFDAGRKRRLPAVPAHIGVVTSPTGAAIRDILTVLRRRFPAIPVTVFPVPVQGREAASAIAEAIGLANRAGSELDPPLDVLIVGRGGGSLEDLWAFNEEVVARAVFESALPVVSAVGHEVDFTIADFVADHRAPTPSAAAEILSPDREEWLQSLEARLLALRRAWRRGLERRNQRVADLRRRLRRPDARIQEQSQRLDELQLRLHRAGRRRLTTDTDRLLQARGRLARANPARALPGRREAIAQLQRRLAGAMQQRRQVGRQRLEQLAGLLHSVSPLNTLERGYAIVSDEGGRLVTRLRDVTVGDRISARLADGCVDARVEATRELEE